MGCCVQRAATQWTEQVETGRDGEESEPEPGTRWVGLYCRLRTRFDACQTLLSICIIMQYIIEIYAISSLSRVVERRSPSDRVKTSHTAYRTYPTLVVAIPLLYFFVMFFLASSNRRTTSWHCVTAQSCFDLLLSSSLKKFSPAAFSTTSTGRQLRRADLELCRRSIGGRLLRTRPTTALRLAASQPRFGATLVDCAPMCTRQTTNNLPGVMKLLMSAESGISLFGSTNAPIASSLTDEADETEVSLGLGFWGYEKSGREARMTLAKWVGTEMDGGLPITS